MKDEKGFTVEEGFRLLRLDTPVVREEITRILKLAEVARKTDIEQIEWTDTTCTTTPGDRNA